MLKEKPNRGPCLTPVSLSGKKEGPFARCRKCATCKTLRTDDWIGRCRAEAQTSTLVEVLTLTYGDGNDPYGSISSEHAKSLYPRDVQDFWKRLRKRGGEFKYLCVGELGSKKQRAHWHAIIFWKKNPYHWGFRHRARSWPKGKKPKGREFARDGEQDVWLHGHVYVDPLMDQKAYRYVLKYIHKDLSHESRFTYSQGIGKHWMLQHWAQIHVDAGICPVDNRYSFGEDRLTDKTGKAWQYRMHKDVATRFVQNFTKLWDDQRPNQALPGNRWFYDCLSKAEGEFVGTIGQPNRHRMQRPTPDDIPPDLRGVVDIRWSDSHNSFYLDCPTTGRLWWSATEEGTFGWSHGITGVSGALIAARKKAEFQLREQNKLEDHLPEPWQHLPPLIMG